MITAPDRLTPQALTLEAAQTKISELVKQYFFTDSRGLSKAVDKIIAAALMRIVIPSLREAAWRSLIEFYYRQVREIQRIGRQKSLVMLALVRLSERGNNAEKIGYASRLTLQQARQIISVNLGESVAKLMGVPLQKYSENYFKEHIAPTLERYAENEALDPDAENYWGRRSSLRNRAEREVRNQWHIDNLSELKESGEKLVIISAHADCSDRCRPFQGRVFSLDGTRGRTDDGRDFVPIEEATDIYTKDGKWKNGLFGFNCRHYAVPYRSGYRFPAPSIKTERKEYAITQKQRYMESRVREWRTKATIFKGVNSDEYLKAKKKADEWNARYIKYSQDNKRAYYPSRTRLI